VSRLEHDIIREKHPAWLVRPTPQYGVSCAQRFWLDHDLDVQWKRFASEEFVELALCRRYNDDRSIKSSARGFVEGMSNERLPA
jgi:hypothetical protein